ncbi:hypothetical protein FRC17_000340 [Serendipita sp. 399]|nr:hypothetical protein FRC17_000340 [Serendipita sp. 399]
MAKVVVQPSFGSFGDIALTISLGLDAIRIGVSWICAGKGHSKEYKDIESEVHGLQRVLEYVEQLLKKRGWDEGTDVEEKEQAEALHAGVKVCWNRLQALMDGIATPDSWAGRVRWVFKGRERGEQSSSLDDGYEVYIPPNLLEFIRRLSKSSKFGGKQFIDTNQFMLFYGPEKEMITRRNWTYMYTSGGAVETSVVVSGLQGQDGSSNDSSACPYCRHSGAQKGRDPREHGTSTSWLTCGKCGKMYQLLDKDVANDNKDEIVSPAVQEGQQGSKQLTEQPENCQSNHSNSDIKQYRLVSVIRGENIAYQCSSIEGEDKTGSNAAAGQDGSSALESNLGDASSSNIASSPRQCTNCGESETPQWRKWEGKYECNGCQQYRKTKSHKPSPWDRPPISRKTRKSTSKDKQGNDNATNAELSSRPAISNATKTLKMSDAQINSDTDASTRTSPPISTSSGSTSTSNTNPTSVSSTSGSGSRDGTNNGAEATESRTIKQVAGKGRRKTGGDTEPASLKDDATRIQKSALILTPPSAYMPVPKEGMKSTPAPAYSDSTTLPSIYHPSLVPPTSSSAQHIHPVPVNSRKRKPYCLGRRKSPTASTNENNV